MCSESSTQDADLLKIAHNSFWAVAEAAVGAIAVFAIYRFVVHELGIAALGVWSVVLSLTSLVRIVDPGAAGGLGRFITIANARGKNAEAAGYFVGGLAFSVTFYLAIAIIAYIPLSLAVQAVIPQADAPRALALLPYAIVSFLFTLLNGSVQSMLIGLHEARRKSQIAILGLCLQLGWVVWFLPSNGLVAVAEAQILQQGWGAGAGVVYVAADLRVRAGGSFRPTFKRESLLEIIRFGASLQLLNIISFLFEPLTKLSLSHFVNLESVGLFELAQKFVLQIRLFVVSTVNVMGPAFAHLSEVGSKQRLQAVFEDSQGTTTFLAIVLLTVGALVAPAISLVWLGSIQLQFMVVFALLSVGWMVNMIAAPAYVLGVARGFVRANLVGAIITSFGSSVLVAFGAKAGGFTGSVMGIALGIAAGAGVAMLWNAREAGVNWRPRPTIFWEKLRARRSWGHRTARRTQ